jgi:hypothetical protein
MPYKDPAKRKAYAREWNKRKREMGSVQHFPEPTTESFRLETVKDLTVVLECCIDEVMTERMPAVNRGRVISALVHAAIKTLELSDIEQRLTVLEKKLLGPAGGTR